MDEYHGTTIIDCFLRSVKGCPKLRHSREYQKKLSPPSPKGS